MAIAIFLELAWWIVSQIVVILVNRVLSDRSVDWPQVRGRNYPEKPVMVSIVWLLMTR